MTTANGDTRIAAVRSLLAAAYDELVTELSQDDVLDVGLRAAMEATLGFVDARAVGDDERCGHLRRVYADARAAASAAWSAVVYATDDRRAMPLDGQ